MPWEKCRMQHDHGPYNKGHSHPEDARRATPRRRFFRCTPIHTIFHPLAARCSGNSICPRIRPPDRGSPRHRGGRRDRRGQLLPQ
eukprot:6355770-Prymnesium_polylepis.1